MKLKLIWAMVVVVFIISCEDPDEKKIKLEYPIYVESDKATIQKFGNSDNCGKVINFLIRKDKEYYQVKPTNINLDTLSMAKTYTIKIKILEDKIRCADTKIGTLDDFNVGIVNYAEVLEIK